ncbi:type VII secretion protein EccE [Streptomyces specialis]|uniref:type VII secretion protein EccE n=1 Tax=Streptomyces specialis TaxID=498367 RepID=UPI00073FA1EF|nr:type VII secretion protein EccE [Streptomyces specialis]
MATTTTTTTTAAPATAGPDRSDRRVAPRSLPGPGGPLPLWPLLCLQGVGALVLLGVAAESPPLGALAVVPAALLVLVCVAWRQGESLPAWIGSALALRRRRWQARIPLPPGEDPLFSLAAECRPGLLGHAFAAPGGPDRRERREVGMAGDGGTLTAVLRVEAAPTPLQPGHAVRPLPLSLLHAALETDGISLESVQSVQYTQPAPAPMLPERSVAGTSYALLQEPGAGVPALRLTWVALRLDPELCPGAIAERGGGLVGAQRCLTRAADQLASRLTGAGFTATVLTQAELLSAVAACAGSDPAATTLRGRGDGPHPRRTVEEPRVWRCDDRWHTTFRVARWPLLGPGATPLPGLVALLTSLPAFATTFALTLRRRGRGSAEVSGHVRITGRGEGELRAADEQLWRAARAAGVGLARMDRRQLSGVQATLPLGGAR